MRRIFHDIRFALRTLRRNPGFTAVSVSALALGIGANTAVFTVVQGVLLRPLPLPRPERLYLVSCAPLDGPFGPSLGVLDHDYPSLLRLATPFSAVGSFDVQPSGLSGSGEPLRVTRAGVTPGLLEILGIAPALGRTFQVGEDQSGEDHVVVLADSLWRSHFGRERSVLGKTVMLDGVKYSVIGVMPPGFSYPARVDLWTPKAIHLDPHTSLFLPVIARLKPGVSPQQAQQEWEAAARGLAPGENRPNFSSRITPLKEIMVGDSRKSLLIFAGAVGLVLLIACANVANLQLIRGTARVHEIAVRAALGATRWRLVRQLLVENLMISLAAGAAGAVLAMWLVPLFLALAPKDKIPRAGEIHMDAAVLAFAFGLATVTSLLFGLTPAMQSAGRGWQGALRTARRAAPASTRLRSVLVVSEVTLAMVLLSGAGLLVKSFLNLRAVRPGFQTDHIMTMTVDLPRAVYQSVSQVHSVREQTLSEIAALPGVTGEAAVNLRPLGSLQVVGDFTLDDGRQLPPGYEVDRPTVSPGYFRAMGIRVLLGREFTDRDDAKSPGVVVISRSVAQKLWPGQEAIGRRISMMDPPTPESWLSVVGTVDDIRQVSLSKNARPAVYQPYRQVNFDGWLRHMTFVVRTAGDPGRLATGMRQALRRVDPNLPAQEVNTMQELVETSTAEPLYQARLLTAFSLLALTLAAIGVYAVLAYSVVERTREIGIRMALGAEAADVIRMVLSRTAVLTMLGVGFGALVSLALNRVLTAWLFEVRPSDGATTVIVGLVLAAVALVAGWLPARQAASVDPLAALRHE